MPDEKPKQDPERRRYSDDATAYLLRAAPPAAPARAHRAIPLGSTLGKYRIDSVLGHGGGGDVYAAEDTVIGRKVAIKVLPPELADDPALLARFRSEAQAAGKLNHPHVVTIYEVMEVDGIFAIVMELVTGGSVQDYLKRKGSPGWRAATRIAGEACKALMAAHEVGLIHRDIKPANLLLTANGHVKVADFGLAKFHSKAATDAALSTQAGAILGTPAFMSPEQCRGDKIDPRTDIYSLGCTYFAMLTGKPPFEAASSMQVMFSHCSAPIPNVCELASDTPAECSELLTKALAKDPAQRYASARDMFADFKALLGSSTIASMSLQASDQLSALPPATISTAPRSSAPEFLRNNKWLAIGAGALVLFLIGLIAIAVVMALQDSGTGKESTTKLAAATHPATTLAAATSPATAPAIVATQPTTQHIAVVDVAPTTQISTAELTRLERAMEEASKLLAAQTQAAASQPATRPSTQIAATHPTSTQPVATQVAQTRPATQPATQPVVKAPFDPARLKTLPGKFTNTLGEDLLLIRPGKFMMGDASLPDAPKHEVTLTQPFYMAQLEINQGDFSKVMGDEWPVKKDLPAAFVTWDEAQKFCAALSELPTEKAAHHVYRLPTEAEWEYACRAGTTTRFAFGATLSRSQANFNKKIDPANMGPPKDGQEETPPAPPPRPGPGGRPPAGGPPAAAQGDPRDKHPLEREGSYNSNAWGIKDMHGSVWEWCADFYAADGYKANGDGPQTDPTGPATGEIHVARGGCWSSTAEQCASAYRNGKADPKEGDPSYGIRLVCEVPPK